ncbi:threonine dehydratase [Pseudoduganella flava]|uniref:Threonine dehydratase n=1 Tax=Pseudoduganella flava TaxID=871742 RepID=A0A562PZ49_9BURK|nr:threonine dehydratase [Pseudoduganella flava]QGZ38750.1 threonine dehydratase [Pseudoduganella flava]TWI49673.1 threonine dehydratase [Pseudoduganella flava]
MTRLPDLADIEAAAATVYQAMPPTPQYNWPLLDEALSTRAWIKHENHTPIGTFKARSGQVYVQRLARRQPDIRGLVSATRGNHGQALALACRRAGVALTIVVPHGNSVEKNASMRALGAQLIEHGDDFQAAREHAILLAERDALQLVPSYGPDLVAGVATGWLELLRACPDVRTVFVPIGQGSGIAGAAAARQALDRDVRIIGVVSAQAPAALLSWQQKRVVEAAVGPTIADGVACRVLPQETVDVLVEHVDDVVAVTEAEVAAAIRLYYRATHNVAEGAAAAALAAALQRRDDPRVRGRVLGLPLTGSNIDTAVLRGVLAEDSP